VVQYTIHDGGRFVARVDLAWPERKVALEYDGVWHATAAQLHRDRRRLNRLATAGWTVLHVTSARLQADFPGILAEVRAALGC
jgi:very-short-patch-repair endonuclease